MDKIDLEQYKNYLLNCYKHEYDNNENKRQERIQLLNNKYKDEYLESIIVGTYNFVNKIIDISENNYNGYIKIPLYTEPDIIYIDLDLAGGWMSDTIVSDSENNFYSVSLLKKIFGERFHIEPCQIDFTREINEEEDFSIVSEIPSYYLYIQCKKEIIDNARKAKVLRI